jgi:gamma-glutamyl:cysteine ligase YbdK (ATP-grasp superfamily)
MPKSRTTVTLDEEVFRAVKIKAARTGKRDSQVIEESLRRDLGLDTLRDIWARVRPAPEGEGMDLATAELQAMREERREAGGS